jgi:hypothetical protein
MALLSLAGLGKGTKQGIFHIPAPPPPGPREIFRSEVAELVIRGLRSGQRKLRELELGVITVNWESLELGVITVNWESLSLDSELGSVLRRQHSRRIFLFLYPFEAQLRLLSANAAEFTMLLCPTRPSSPCCWFPHASCNVCALVGWR